MKLNILPVLWYTILQGKGGFVCHERSVLRGSLIPSVSVSSLRKKLAGGYGNGSKRFFWFMEERMPKTSLEKSAVADRWSLPILSISIAMVLLGSSISAEGLAERVFLTADSERRSLHGLKKGLDCSAIRLTFGTVRSSPVILRENGILFFPMNVFVKYFMNRERACSGRNINCPLLRGRSAVKKTRDRRHSGVCKKASFASKSVFRRRSNSATYSYTLWPVGAQGHSAPYSLTGQNEPKNSSFWRHKCCFGESASSQGSNYQFVILYTFCGASFKPISEGQSYSHTRQRCLAQELFVQTVSEKISAAYFVLSASIQPRYEPCRIPLEELTQGSDSQLFFRKTVVARQSHYTFLREEAIAHGTQTTQGMV